MHWFCRQNSHVQALVAALATLMPAPRMAFQAGDVVEVPSEGRTGVVLSTGWVAVRLFDGQCVHVRAEALVKAPENQNMVVRISGPSSDTPATLAPQHVPAASAQAPRVLPQVEDVPDSRPLRPVAAERRQEPAAPVLGSQAESPSESGSEAEPASESGSKADYNSPTSPGDELPPVASPVPLPPPPPPPATSSAKRARSASPLKRRVKRGDDHSTEGPGVKEWQCRYWKRDVRNCRRGLWCTFAHGEAEVGTPIRKLPPGKLFRERCTFFIKKKCHKGDKCEFIHDE